MLRHVITGAAIVATTGLSTVTLADATNGSGAYLRGQAGYDWVGKKSDPITLAAGLARLHSNINVDSKKNHGFAGRVAAGYALNQYFSLESGFTKFHDVYRDLSSAQIRGPIAQATTAAAQTKTSLYAIDLIAKATIPFDNLYAFVAGGAAYVHQKNAALTTTASNYADIFGGSANSLPVTVLAANRHGYVRPKAEIGVGYNLTSHLALDVSYSRIFGKGNVNTQQYVPNLNFAALGLTYKF